MEVVVGEVSRRRRTRRIFDATTTATTRPPMYLCVSLCQPLITSAPLAYLIILSAGFSVLEYGAVCAGKTERTRGAAGLAMFSPRSDEGQCGLEWAGAVASGKRSVAAVVLTCFLACLLSYLPD